MTLTPKQAAFVREYLVDLCATHAAERAGYRGRCVNKTAANLMLLPQIQEAIADGQKARAERVDDDADQVLRDIRRIGQSAEEAGKFEAALKATELRGKHLGMFKTLIEHQGRVVLAHEMTDGELARIAAGRSD